MGFSKYPEIGNIMEFDVKEMEVIRTVGTKKEVNQIEWVSETTYLLGENNILELFDLGEEHKSLHHIEVKKGIS